MYYVYPRIEITCVEFKLLSRPDPMAFNFPIFTTITITPLG